MPKFQMNQAHNEMGNIHRTRIDNTRQIHSPSNNSCMMITFCAQCIYNISNGMITAKHTDTYKTVKGSNSEKKWRRHEQHSSCSGVDIHHSIVDWWLCHPRCSLYLFAYSIKNCYAASIHTSTRSHTDTSIQALARNKNMLTSIDVLRRACSSRCNNCIHHTQWNRSTVAFDSVISEYLSVPNANSLGRRT